MNENIISKENILNELFQKQRFGIKPGLERTLELCEVAGNPQNKFRSVHVAGTNGKGSVCSGIAAVMMSAGYKTGLYNSPHLIDFNERIRVNKNLISDEKIIEYYLLLKDKANQISATFFEITTVMAFMYFAEQKVDLAVIETGMGGRFDSTNVITPLLTAITKIDLDHQEYLGDTIEKIAFEKAGIIKENIPCIVGANSTKVYDVISKATKKSGFILSESRYKIKQLPSANYTSTLWHIDSFIGKGFEIEFGILGKNQVDNIKVILSSILILTNHFKIIDKHIYRGLEDVKKLTGISARIDILSEKPLIILDGAHNTNSVNNLFDTLSALYPEKKWNIIFNIMADKEIKNIHVKLKKFADSIVIPKLNTERASKCHELADKLISKKVLNVRTKDSVGEALEFLRTKDNILIFGSFYLAGEVLEYFERKKLQE